MKRFIFLTFALCALVMVSCEDAKNATITYNVDVIGDADGDVCVTFPNGSLELDGKTDIAFHIGNESTETLALKDSKFVDSVKVKNAVESLTLTLPTAFQATSASGSYYLSVKGYAMVYGVKVSIDEVLTNRK